MRAAGVCAPAADGIKRLRDISDRIKQKSPESVLVLGLKDPAEDKVSGALRRVFPA